MTDKIIYGVHPSATLRHARAATLHESEFKVPSMMPVCNTSLLRCEIWVPSAAFGLPTEGEKKLAAKLYGYEKGEDGWYYEAGEMAEKPGWIVVKRSMKARKDALADM